MSNLTAADIDTMLAEARAKTAAAWDTMRQSNLRDVIDTGDGPLVVVNASYGKRPDLADLDGDALMAALNESDYTMVVLSEDGGYVPERVQWATDDPTCPIERWVRYERWTPEGRVAHGYIHPESRRLIQSG